MKKILLATLLGFLSIPVKAAIGTGQPGGIAINFILDEGSTITQRNKLNWIGSPINCVDNPGQLRIDCTVLSSTSSGTASPLEVFSNFDGTRSSPTASISIGDGLKLTVSGSTAIINIDFSSVTSRSDVILNQNTLQRGATFYVSSGTVNGQLSVFGGSLRAVLLPSTTEAFRLINISSHQVFMVIQTSGTVYWRIGSDVTGLAGVPSYDIYNATTGVKDISISTNDVITINGTMAFSPLTASRPLKLNASKQVISALIDLVTDVTGILPSTNLPSNVVYTNVQQTISASKVFTASQTFNDLLVANSTFVITGSTLIINGTTYYWQAGLGGSGKFLMNNAGVITSSTPAGTGGGGGSTSPGGSNTNIQFNNSGSFGGDNGLQYDSSVSSVTHKGAFQTKGPFKIVTSTSATAPLNPYTEELIAANGVPNSVPLFREYVYSPSGTGKLSMGISSTDLTGSDTIPATGILFTQAGGMEIDVSGSTVLSYAGGLLDIPFPIVIESDMYDSHLTPGTSGYIWTSRGAGISPEWKINTGSGGSGSSTLAVGTGTATNFTTSVTSPTAVIAFNGALFRSVANGTTNFINLDTVTANGLLMISSAAATYLTLSSASATYFPLISSTTLLTTSSATLNYLTLSSASATYFNKNSIYVSSINGNTAITVSANGTSGSVVALSLNSSSVTLYGPNIPAAAISAGSLGPNVLASSFPVTGVTAGSYTNTNLTVDAQGHIIAASNGTAGGGGSASTSAGGIIYTSSSNFTQTGISTTPVVLTAFLTAGNATLVTLSTTNSSIVVSTTAVFNFDATIFSTGTGNFTQYFEFRVNGATTGFTCQDTPSARCVLMGQKQLTLGDTVQIYTSVNVTAGSTITITDAQFRISAVGGAGGTSSSSSGAGISGSTTSIVIAFNGGGSTITTTMDTSTTCVKVSYACTISTWSIISIPPSPAGSISVEIKRATFANFPTLTSISGSGNTPTLTNATKNAETPSGWTSTSISQDDVVCGVVNSATSVSNISITMGCIR